MNDSPGSVTTFGSWRDADNQVSGIRSEWDRYLEDSYLRDYKGFSVTITLVGWSSRWISTLVLSRVGDIGYSSDVDRS
jgi:hypothetical protein